jgi:hypothetical protein
MTRIPTNGNSNTVHNRKRDGGRAAVYFSPDMKSWLAQHAVEKGRSLSGMVDHICTEYAKENGYEAPVEELAAELVDSTPQVKANMDADQINQLGQALAATLTQFINGAKCLTF